MVVLMVIGLQAGTAAAGPPTPLPAPIRIVRPCPSSDEGGDVVVCARPGEADRYRLKPLPATAAGDALPRAEMRVFGKAKVSAETEAASVGGFVSNRAMVRLKVPF